MPRTRAKSFLRVAALLAPISLALAACETLENFSPFDEQKKPLTGDRRSVFPEGVPGVQRSAPPTQPSNSNIQVGPQEMQGTPPDAPPAAAPSATASRRGAPQNSGDDPWAGQRR